MPSHDLLVLWTQLASLLLAARVLGAVANRIGQPAVAGELTAGLILGPSVLGHVWPAGFHWLFPGKGGSTPLAAITAISLAGLLVAIGAETDLPLIRRLGRAATSVASVSLLVPLAAGAALALLLPGDLVGRHAGTAPFVILVAGAVGVSSLPVIAKIVSDLGLVRRNFGQLAIATGTSHDAIGFVLVALATGLAGNSGSSGGRVAVALIGVAGVSAVILTAGQRVFDLALRQVRRNGPNVAGSLSVCVAGAMGAAAVMQAFGVEGALGAFVAGVALGRSRFQLGRAVSVLDTMTTTIFAPLYFSAAGLRVDLGVLGRGSVAVSFAAILGVAVVAKFAGAALGGRLARLHRREILALGVGLNGRGALQVVLATAGLGIGVLTTASYTLIILMSVVSSLAVPPLLRLILGGWAGTEEEQERLGREEQLERNVVVRGQRLLLASRGSRSSIVAAEVVGATWPKETEVTVLSIGAAATDEMSPAVQTILDVLADRTVEHRKLVSEQVADQILAEANLGYGAIALGAADEPEGGHLLSPVLDELLMRSPLPLIIVRRPRRTGGRLPGVFEKVLVPVTGTPSSRAGQEVACNLSQSLGTQVVLTHVVTRGDGDIRRAEEALAGVGAPGPAAATRGSAAGRAPAPGGSTVVPPAAPPRRQLAAAEGGAQVVLRGAWDMAIEMGVEPEVVVRHGRAAGDEILAAAAETGADVLALGATVRHVEGRPFLGHTVEQVLTSSDATVVVVALPDQSSRLGSAMAEATS
ncbi:MAG TPA: cation:proton antiporter [Acidimicrobiales bacterium]|nr:cation:proton antiporter [Acidimicrobiales bacterium]